MWNQMKASAWNGPSAMNNNLPARCLFLIAFHFNWQHKHITTNSTHNREVSWIEGTLSLNWTVDGDVSHPYTPSSRDGWARVLYPSSSIQLDSFYLLCVQHVHDGETRLEDLTRQFRESTVFTDDPLHFCLCVGVRVFCYCCCQWAV